MKNTRVHTERGLDRILLFSDAVIALYLGTAAFTMLMTRIEEVVLAAAGLRT